MSRSEKRRMKICFIDKTFTYAFKSSTSLENINSNIVDTFHLRQSVFHTGLCNNLFKASSSPQESAVAGLWYRMPITNVAVSVPSKTCSGTTTGKARAFLVLGAPKELILILVG